MYKIQSDTTGAVIGLTEKPNYIRLTDNGCFALCAEAEATGICYNGAVYALFWSDELKSAAADTVSLQFYDAGAAMAAAEETAAMAHQLSAVSRLYVQANEATVPDAAALEMPDLFRTWEEVLSDGSALAKDAIINGGGQLYRVVQDGGVTPQEHQPPHGEGMLAVYRPIEPDHAGTQEDPIPWAYGMDCRAGQYFSYNGKIYKVAVGGDMIPCVWAPDSGIWQWEVVA